MMISEELFEALEVLARASEFYDPMTCLEEEKVYPHKLNLNRHRLHNQVTNRKPRFPIKKII